MRAAALAALLVGCSSSAFREAPHELEPEAAHELEGSTADRLELDGSTLDNDARAGCAELYPGASAVCSETASECIVQSPIAGFCGELCRSNGGACLMSWRSVLQCVAAEPFGCTEGSLCRCQKPSN